MSHTQNTPDTLAEEGVSFNSAKNKASNEVKRKKVSTQMNEVLLLALRKQAKSEGRHFQAVVEDAVRAYLKAQQGYQMRSDVKAALDNTLKRFPETLKTLAK